MATMLCCGRKKENVDHVKQRIIGEGTSLGYVSHPQYQYYQPPAGVQQPRRAVHFHENTYQDGLGDGPRTRMPEMVLQSDFRKVSGISSEVFRQIEAVEKEFDATTAANMEAVEKRGEMIIRLLDPRQLGRAGAEAGRKYLNSPAGGGGGGQSVQFVEIIKRPGQTLGLYIREGDGFRCSEGVFISRIALESPVYTSGLLKVGDEILAVNLVDVRRISLDDVVIIMSIPRRLVLTIRSRTCRPGMNPAVDMCGNRRSFNEEYRQPPVVVVKKDLGEDDSFANDDLSSNRDSENGHLMQARLKGLPADIPSVAISLSNTDSMLFNDPVYGYGRTGVRMPQRPGGLDAWTHMQVMADDGRTRPYGVVTRQPQTLQRQYHRTLENMAGQTAHQLYSGYTSDVPVGPRRPGGIPNSVSMQRPIMDRNSPRHRFWDDYGQTGSLRRGKLLRTESDNRIHPTTSDYFLDQYNRPMSRGSRRSQTPTGYSGISAMHGVRGQRSEDLRQSFSTHGLSNMMRRRRVTDGSVSDTEVDSITSRPPSVTMRQRPIDRYVADRGVRQPRDLFQNRSNSLPRTRGDPMTDYRYPKPSSRRGHSVRFERNRYGGVLDEDSDGALSAPELPDDTRARRLLARQGPSPAGYSSDEYRRWLRRAPSTSAIYETIRRSGRSSTLPSGLSSSSLYRIAHSAESLLDTIRAEQQKTLIEGIYNPRAPIAIEKTPPHSSLLAKRDYSSDSLSGLKSGLRSRSHLLSHSLGLDYARPIPTPTPVKASDDERMHLLTLNPREFFKYRYEKPTTTQDGTNTTSDAVNNSNPSTGKGNGFSGLLWVHLLAGRGLRSASVPAGHRDLYCVIECDRVHKARTVVRSGESSFDWDEIFELDLYEIKEISFLLYSWDPQSRHKLCYKGVINLLSLSLNETPVHSLALKMEPKGTLYVKIRYKDISAIFQRSPSSPSTVSTLFGIDLETIVTRENSGFNVPLIVKRCVEEVEKRGLDLVGIYRLCGSAVRKKMLRDAFEKNAWLVDLSAEHVPDINVITSLLKDYIRELPEPLFTKALFEMMADGLSVCLPDDPAGNAKLMFSILECLPKVNRCTVLYFLDHLKLVVTHSDRNKMNSQATAICFGPLFMCHSESENLQRHVEVFKFLLEIWPTRRGTISRNGSNDSSAGLHLPPSSGISVLDQTNQSTNPLSSAANSHTSAPLSISLNTSSQLIHTSSGTDHLPIATLTPGPSPTAVTSFSEVSNSVKHNPSASVAGGSAMKVVNTSSSANTYHNSLDDRHKSISDYKHE